MDISTELLYTAFNYRVQTNEEKSFVDLDLSMVLYNDLYKLPEFFEQKFPAGHENIPAFETILQMIAYKNINNSPLQEYNQRLLAKEQN